MKIQGIQYRHPFIYKLLIPLIHTRSVVATFREEVGTNKEIFDVAAGFGHMASYLDRSNKYYGIDLNEKFVGYGRSKGLNIDAKDIFEPTSYKKSDVFILVDLIHHLPSNSLPKLFDLIFSHAREKVVILEPSFMSLENKYGFIGNLIEKFFMWADSDGINKIERWYTEDEYKKMFENRFGSEKGGEFTLKVRKIFPYYLITFTKI